MIAILTSKGQLTIPKAVREKLSLHTGWHVSFVVIDGRAELTPFSTPLHTLKTVLVLEKSTHVKTAQQEILPTNLRKAGLMFPAFGRR